MDYKTKPTSRKELRRYARLFRYLFKVPQTGAFPVLEVLEQVPDVFQGSNFVVLEDTKMQPRTMAQCAPNDYGGFTIEIKESVYRGTYEKHTGALLGFICHEICHVFLFEIGFTPIYARTFNDRELPPCCSVEWQAKALCAEVMIPFSESRGMTSRQIMEYYHVSQAFAKHRRKLDIG